MKVSDQENFAAPKRLALILRLPEDNIDTVQDIGPHHGDFINHDKLDLFPKPITALIGQRGLINDLKREAKKGVNGLAANIKRGNARRREDSGMRNNALGLDVVNQRGFTRPCFARHEDRRLVV